MKPKLKKADTSKPVSTPQVKSNKKDKSKRKLTKSEAFAIWCVVVATVMPVISTVLSILGKANIESLAGTIFTACIGYLITYAGKSAFEKGSRNKYGLDEDGNPLCHQENTEDYNERAKGENV